MNNNFKEYLLNVDDKETLRRLKIGVIFRPIFEIENIIEERYEQKKDEKYLIYSEQYREMVTQTRIFGIFLFILLIFYAILNK